MALYVHSRNGVVSTYKYLQVVFWGITVKGRPAWSAWNSFWTGKKRAKKKGDGWLNGADSDCVLKNWANLEGRPRLFQRMFGDNLNRMRHLNEILGGNILPVSSALFLHWPVNCRMLHMLHSQQTQMSTVEIPVVQWRRSYFLQRVAGMCHALLCIAVLKHVKQPCSNACKNPFWMFLVFLEQFLGDETLLWLYLFPLFAMIITIMTIIITIVPIIIIIMMFLS